MVHNKYIDIGVFWTSADPPPRRLSWPPSWPPQLHRSRTAAVHEHWTVIRLKSRVTCRIHKRVRIRVQNLQIMRA